MQHCVTARGRHGAAQLGHCVSKPVENRGLRLPSYSACAGTKPGKTSMVNICVHRAIWYTCAVTEPLRWARCPLAPSLKPSLAKTSVMHLTSTLKI